MDLRPHVLALAHCPLHDNDIDYDLYHYDLTALTYPTLTWEYCPDPVIAGCDTIQASLRGL